MPAGFCALVVAEGLGTARHLTVAPNGDVFTIGPAEDKSFFLNVPSQTWTQVGGSSGVTNGSSVMYRPGKILYSGGTPGQTSSSPAQATNNR